MTESRTNIDRIIAACRRDSRTVSGSERRALCDEIERLRKRVEELEKCGIAMEELQRMFVEEKERRHNAGL